MAIYKNNNGTWYVMIRYQDWTGARKQKCKRGFATRKEVADWELQFKIDYIPVANGYKTGMKTRNSLTKALQQMGFAKAVSKKENETVAWQQRERTYLTELCQEKGIDVEVLGVQRDNLTLPEYKAAMQKVEKLEHQAVKREENN